MPKYLRKPDFNDIQKLYTAHNNIHGFPGMLGSIDCMHWEWRNCPKAWHGQFGRGDKKYPTILLEAVASYDLWIWHAFFGVAGANNDLTVLNNSPLFDDLLDGIDPVAPFECNGVTFEKGYYLADDIYPQWASFVKSFTVASSEKNVLYKRKQEGARKDIERAFGVLQGRWRIISQPARAWTINKLRRVMHTCIILHNMILEDQNKIVKAVTLASNIESQPGHPLLVHLVMQTTPPELHSHHGTSADLQGVVQERSYIPYKDRRLSISEEALGAFGKIQTYRYEGFVISPRVGQALLQLVTSREYTNYLLSAEDRYRGRGYDRGQEAEQKQVKIMEDRRDKLQAEYHAARDSDDTLVCCVENTVEDRIMDYGASFHATYCKEELERFKLCSGKVRLADDKTLDIASVGDVVLKTYFGTSWTLKDVRYIPSLKRRLISVGQLDKEGYHVGFGEQQWKVTKGSLVVVHGNKRGSLYMVEDWLFGEAEKSFFHNVSEDKETVKVKRLKFDNGGEYSSSPIKFCVKNEIVMLKMVPETPLQFGVVERLSRTFRAESTGIRAEASKMLWANSVSTTYLIYYIPYVLIGLRIPEEECGSDEMRYSFRDTKSYQERQVVLVDIPKNLTENDSIVAEHGLSSEITQSPGGSSDMSEGSENSGSFEDSGRSDEEYSEDGASSKEGGSKTPYIQRSTRESRAPKKAIYEEMVSLEKNQTCSLVRISSVKKALQRLWMFKVKEEQNGRKSCKDDYNQRGFSASWAERKPRVQIEGNFIRTDSSAEAMNEEPCSDVHQVGDEIEVEVLRSFNWPSSELITGDGLFPERGYSQFNDVSSGYLVSKVS
ncbi:retrovirus-related pol polyprotein from transposon TNT 1-94 [Tanacetum coccineum]